MEKLLLSAEHILCHLRQNRINKNDIKIIKLLESVEKNECERKSYQYKILEEFLQMIASETSSITDPIDVDLIISCVILLTHLQEQQKLPQLSESQFSKLWQWLFEQYKCNEVNVNVVCRIIVAISNMFAVHPDHASKHIVSATQIILNNTTANTTEFFLITNLQCLYKILSAFKEVKLSDEQCTALSKIGQTVFQLHYDESPLIVESSNVSALILYTLQILYKVVALNSIFAHLQIDELLGLSKLYFNFGLKERSTLLLKPQKVCISQQALHDSAEEIESAINSEKAQNCGGKTPKTRKPRAVSKNARPNENRTTNCSPEIRCGILAFDIKASDSEVSEPENASNHILFERNRNSKIRLASISLVGSIVRIVERKTLFGYWHVLFPSGTDGSTENLLYVSQHDPNLRCRSAALQVCTHLLYGSKGYVRQAEINVKRCPTTYMPFSISLGFTVLGIYKTLTAILNAESSVLVLTQTLKCLAVLVQASTFKQFEKGFVQNFVKAVKPLIYHRDAAIQVSALMVMEFLVALPETTSDIAESIGVPQEVTTNTRKNVQVSNQEVDTIDIEEFVESEDDSNTKENDDGPEKKVEKISQSVEETSWLLKRILYNLSKQDKVVPSSVRIESLQVLIVMTSRFGIIKPHLTKVTEVLLYSLKDVLPDVRLYAARCVDACAFQISRYLSDNAICSEDGTREFWLNMMPFIMNQIRRDSEEMTTVRITFCDALSNIGAVMYECLPHSSQISLLSFLTGVISDSTEESLVRSAAARALAVFALYPSLLGDLVFIENTAELTLHLVTDSNLLVRIKSFWSLGNISDALIAKETKTTQLWHERISDDLLFRLITAANAACTDNDKVRCNAVRTLGNLLRLLNDIHLNSDNTKLNWRQLFTKSICKLSDCIRTSGNAKVKWNSCYAISNLMRNTTIFEMNDLSWQGTMFPVLCHVIVHHHNFKVRINASLAIINITKRTYFGIYYEKCWLSIVEAVEQSHKLDNFHEYNHRDNLQEQLCLALSHIIRLALNDDLPMLKKHILPRAEIINNTLKRVRNRMVPEKAAPLLSCPIVLLERVKHDDELSLEQKSILNFLIEILSTE